MTSDEAFAKIVIILSPHLLHSNMKYRGNPMPQVRMVLEELEQSTQEKTIEKVVK